MQTHLDSIPYVINSGFLNFAGMRGRLADMQRQGWSFAIDQSWNPHRDERDLLLTAKHDQARTTLIARAPLRSSHLYSEAGRYFEIEFNTWHVAPRIEVLKMELPSMVQWGAFDASDMKYGHVSRQSVYELGAMAFFKPVEAAKEIYIPEKEIWTVEKHLEAILAEQKPYQDELRRKHLKEKQKKALNEGCESRAVAALVAV